MLAAAVASCGALKPTGSVAPTLFWIRQLGFADDEQALRVCVRSSCTLMVPCCYGRRVYFLLAVVCLLMVFHLLM